MCLLVEIAPFWTEIWNLIEVIESDSHWGLMEQVIRQISIQSKVYQAEDKHLEGRVEYNLLVQIRPILFALPPKFHGCGVSICKPGGS